MKRYVEYKNSGIKWIEKIPNDWEIKRLRFLGNLNAGGVDKKINEGEPLTKSVHYMDVYRALLHEIFNTDDYLVVSATKQKHDKCTLQKGDVLFTTSSETPEDIGHSCVVGEDLLGTVFGYHLMRFRPTIELCINYEKYLFGGYFLRKWFEYRAIGMTRYGISNIDFSDAKIFLPPIESQKKIADYLDRKTAAIDIVISDKEKLVELLREKRSAVISEAVTKGLDKNMPMKNSGVEWIGEIPEHWNISRIGYESWVRARLGWKGLKAEEYIDDGYIFLSTPNIKNREIDFENVNYISKERFDESPEIKLSIGDVLLAKDGSTLGTVNVVRQLPSETTVNSSIAVITPYGRFDSIYMYYLFQANCITNLIQMKKGGMGVPHLFQADINKFYIPCPPKEEQRLIAGFLDRKTMKIESLIDEVNMQIEKLKEYRSAIISEAVTGKVAV